MDNNRYSQSAGNPSTPLLKKNRTCGSYYTFANFFRKQNFEEMKARELQGSVSNETYDINDGGVDSTVVSNGLKRQLKIYDLIAYGLGSTLGTGILVSVGQVAQTTTGPAVIISFLLAGFASFLSALCYSEFAARIPLSGSAYSFAYVALGEIIAWFVGWNLTLEYAISASAVAGGWTSYVVAAMNSAGYYPGEWATGYIFPWSDIITVNLLSPVVIMGCTAVLLFGMKESATFNVAMTCINMTIILFFIIAGSFYVKPANWRPFLPFGMKGAWAGVGEVFFSYIGFDAVSTLAGEVANPARDLPIGIIGTLLLVTMFYVVVALVLTGMVPYQLINVNAPLADAFIATHVNLHWAKGVIAFGSITVITATVLTSLIGQPRIFYQMSQDGLIFKLFGKLNGRGVPLYGTIITGVLSSLIALFFNLNALLDMISIGTLLAFTVVCGGVVILRYEPDVVTPQNKSQNTPLLVFLYFIGCVIFSIRNVVHIDVRKHLHGKTDAVYTGIDFLVYVAFAIPLLIVFVKLCTLKANNVPVSFKCPLVPFIPCLGMLMNTWFILSLPVTSIYRLIIWTAIGLAIYFGYGVRNSKLNKD